MRAGIASAGVKFKRHTKRSKANDSGFMIEEQETIRDEICKSSRH